MIFFSNLDVHKIQIISLRFYYNFYEIITNLNILKTTIISIDVATCFNI